jgi:hypothetical protein
MDPTRTSTPVLDEANADFIQHHVSISIAARDARNRPAVARALGCGVSTDRRLVRLFLVAPRAAAVLENLRDNGAVAAVFTRPSTHMSLQLKGKVANIEPLSAADRGRLIAYLHSFAEDLGIAGYNPGFVHSIAVGADEECVAVCFEPLNVFVQTPGPQAGQRLEPRA